MREIFISLFPRPARRHALRRRVGLARAALARVYAGSSVAPAAACPDTRSASPWQTSQLIMRVLATHGWLIVIVLLIGTGEVAGDWSTRLIAPTRLRGLPLRLPGAESAEQVVAALPAAEEVRRFSLQASITEPVTPALSTPRELTEAFREVHLLAEGETLGGIALRYGVSIASIALANGLERGDALLLGQPLRIPRVSGSPYVVAEGDDVGLIAARFGVSEEHILTFGPNHLRDGGGLEAGREIFIPGGDRPLPGAAPVIGGLEALSARGPEPAGVVIADETNMRSGPSTEHERVAQLERGRQVALRARHADWLKVQIADTTGWMRADMLQVADGLVDRLPETDDFPPPPPRWVWPAWGTLSSGFGSRWGGFHNGIDIANRAWTPIVAARAGRVIEAGWCSGYGYCVKLSHGGGVETIYGHLITKPHVGAGDEVAVGQRIGSMGSTYDRAGGGYSTGVHLHFTVLVNGRAVNPLTVLP